MSKKFLHIRRTDLGRAAIKKSLIDEINRLRSDNEKFQKECFVVSAKSTAKHYAFMVEAEERSYERAMETMSVLKDSGKFAHK